MFHKAKALWQRWVRPPKRERAEPDVGLTYRDPESNKEQKERQVSGAFPPPDAHPSRP